MKDRAYYEGIEHESGEDIDLFVFTIEEMAIFWSQLCKEQRNLCWHNSKPENTEILDAPEPEFE